MVTRAAQSAYYLAGIGFLGLAWAKNRLRGYVTPDTVEDADPAGRAEHVIDAVQTWRRFLPANAITGKDVLELCPGASLGTGALLLAHGARSYRAVDAFPLAARENPAFRLDVVALPEAGIDDDNSRQAQAALRASDGDRFSYAVDRGFDIVSLCDGRSFDLIVSSASFEHFDDIDTTIAQISRVARPGAISAHLVDFQTHSRWVRDQDPNNIYRYPDAMYRLFGFPGQPNRKRPDDYIAAFEREGWVNVRVIEAASIPARQLGQSTSGLSRRFQRPGAQMQMLAGVVIAERPAV